MQRLLVTFLTFFVLSTSPITAFSWNELGHMVIANIAYENLQPSIRSKVDNLVSYINKEYLEMNSFTHIAYWPDSIRSQRIEMFTHWHYIDVPFSTDGTPLKDIVDKDNAVWALNHITPIVKNNRANVYERVRFLAFFAHIVGDLHQPLHTVSNISAAHPNGDKGGNLYMVRYKNQLTKLHRLWDGGAGTFTCPPSDKNSASVAKMIMDHYPKSYFGDKINDLNPTHWTEEGMAIAKKYVYNTPENELLSTSYIENAKQIAEQEAALAGYRLANLLNQFLVDDRR